MTEMGTGVEEVVPVADTKLEPHAEDNDASDSRIAEEKTDGDDAVEVGAAIGDDYETAEAVDDDSMDDDDGVVIVTSKSSLKRGTPMKGRPGISLRTPGIKEMGSTATNKEGVESEGAEDELQKLRFNRHFTAFDVCIEGLPEHPWRDKNTDVSDYFNYGFTERTWLAYCEKQLRLRAEKGLGPRDPSTQAAKPFGPTALNSSITANMVDVTIRNIADPIGDDAASSVLQQNSVSEQMENMVNKTVVHPSADTAAAPQIVQPPFSAVPPPPPPPSGFVPPHQFYSVPAPFMPPMPNPNNFGVPNGFPPQSFIPPPPPPMVHPPPMQQSISEDFSHDEQFDSKRRRFETTSSHTQGSASNSSRPTSKRLRDESRDRGDRDGNSERDRHADRNRDYKSSRDYRDDDRSSRKKSRNSRSRSNSRRRR